MKKILESNWTKKKKKKNAEGSVVRNKCMADISSLSRPLFSLSLSLSISPILSVSSFSSSFLSVSLYISFSPISLPPFFLVSCFSIFLTFLFSLYFYFFVGPLSLIFSFCLVTPFLCLSFSFFFNIYRVPIT